VNVSYSQIGLNSTTAEYLVETIRAHPCVTEMLVKYGFTIGMLLMEHTEVSQLKHAETHNLEMLLWIEGLQSAWEVLDEGLSGPDHVELDRLMTRYVGGNGDLVEEILLARYRQSLDDFVGFSQ
jgi:hypothetical protein